MCFMLKIKIKQSWACNHHRLYFRQLTKNTFMKPIDSRHQKVLGLIPAAHYNAN